jgi:serine/threonine protein kinase
MTTLVRICPVCGAENPPEQLHCLVCTSLLVDVETEDRRQKTEDGRHAGASRPVTEPSSVISPLSSGQPLICADPDCGQANPPGTERCLYCDTPLTPAAAPPTPTPTEQHAFDLEPFMLDHIASPGWQRPVSRIRLPRELAARFEIVRELPVAGSEADLLVVVPKTPGEDAPEQGEQLLKLYRPGIRPDDGLLARLARAGEHVVRFFAHGVADGLSWELMEYCAGGNLRDALKGRLVDRETFRRIARELAAGVKEVHTLDILHRDLKPENVLVRSRAPLTLVLTDFGIASLNESTRLFTDTARTVKYAAPEALTGVLDAKADWWSVGMMLLEIAAGQHPFAGLSEQVINHHLATRPIEIGGVADADAARLCRGLLLRDPEQRWSAPEVERWLAGDPTLLMPVERGANPAATPYRLGEQTARNGEELAALLAASPENWRIGVGDFKRGMIQDWVRDELKDFNLSRHIADIMETHGEPPERGLLRFLLAAAPGLPPLWQGLAVSRETLTRAAHRAHGEKKTEKADEDGATKAREWLASILENDILGLFVAQGHREFEELAREWRRILQDIRRFWEETRKASEAFQGKKSGQGFANFDSLVYGRDDNFDFPPKRFWYPLVILALVWDAFLPALRRDVERAAQELIQDAPWFGRFVDARETRQRSAEVAAVLAASRMAHAARASAEQVRQKRLQQRAAWLQDIAALRARFAVTLHPFLEPLPKRLDAADIHALRAALTLFHGQVMEAAKPDFLEKEYVEFSRQANALAYQADQLEAALEAMDDAIMAGRFARDLVFGSFARTFALFVIFLFIVVMVIKFAPGTLFTVFCILAAAGVPLWLRARRRTAHRALTRQHNLFKRSCEKFLNDGTAT